MEKTLVEIGFEEGDMIDELLKLSRKEAAKRGDSNCVICAQRGHNYIWPSRKMIMIADEHGFDGICIEHYRQMLQEEN